MKYITEGKFDWELLEEDLLPWFLFFMISLFIYECWDFNNNLNNKIKALNNRSNFSYCARVIDDAYRTTNHRGY
jgi:hypothetical protein